MGGGPARIYPKANTTAQWWETAFDRGTFSRIEKILLHTTETTSWPGYKSGASAPTLTYHPRRREWRQHNYLDTSARALVDPTSTAVRENRDGVIQIEIIAYSDGDLAETVNGLKVTQLTADHYRDLAEFIAFVRREWGGPPLVFPPRSDPRMTGPEYDAFKGILDHSDASGNTHWDAGAFDFPRLINTVKAIEAPAPTPAPAPVPEEDELMAVTVKNPLTGAQWSIEDALWSIWTYSYQASVDAAAALAVSKAAAAKGEPLTADETEAIVKEAMTGAVFDVRIGYPAPPVEPTPDAS